MHQCIRGYIHSFISGYYHSTQTPLLRRTTFNTLQVDFQYPEIQNLKRSFQLHSSLISLFLTTNLCEIHSNAVLSSSTGKQSRESLRGWWSGALSDQQLLRKHLTPGIGMFCKQPMLRRSSMAEAAKYLPLKAFHTFIFKMIYKIEFPRVFSYHLCLGQLFTHSLPSSVLHPSLLRPFHSQYFLFLPSYLLGV